MQVNEDEEPFYWDVLEERYGRRLSESELRFELESEYGFSLTDAQFKKELAIKADWDESKERARQATTESLANEERAQKFAEDLYFEMCSPPDDDDSTQIEAWIERVNEMIRTRLDFISLAKLIGVSEKIQRSLKASNLAFKRHAETRAMKAEVFKWLDDNMSQHKSMDSAAQAITKQQPIVFRTARDWVGEWKKLRSASTP